MKHIGILGTGLLGLPLGKRVQSFGQAGGQTYVVEMKDFFYDPIGLTLNRGDRVIWLELENVLDDGHTATAFHPEFDKVLRIPKAAEPWDSGFLFNPGETWERTFTIPGIHDYFCIPHEDMGMVGRIVVEEASGPGTRPLNEGISAAGQSTIPSIEEMLGVPGEVFNFQGRLNAAIWLLRQNDRQQALESWKTLAVEVKALFPQFLGILSDEDQQTFQAKIEMFDQIITTTKAIQDVISAADVLKSDLERWAYHSVS